MTDEEMSSAYATRVGERLRDVRKQQRLSLHAVEAASREEFKASVLGAYERGERVISVPRLHRLAQFYGVPVDQFLPRGSGPEAEEWGKSRKGFENDGADGAAYLSIDLTRLEQMSAPEREVLASYLRMIQVERQDFNGRVLTIRHEDTWAIACLLGTPPKSVRGRLEELGLSR